MRFSLAHKRMVIGHRVTVKVVAASGEAIERVVTRLDGRRLGDDRLTPAEIQYERLFEQVGGAGPGTDHVLLVTATNADNESRSASLRWTDTV
jgi:hypothetical protein